MPNRIRAVKPAAAAICPAGFSQLHSQRVCPFDLRFRVSFWLCHDSVHARTVIVDAIRGVCFDNFVPEAVVDIQKLKNLAMRILSFLPSVVSNDGVEIKQPTVEMRAFNDKRPPIWQRVQKASSSRLDDQAGMLCEGDFLVKFWDGFLMFFDPSRASCFIPTHDLPHISLSSLKFQNAIRISETASVTLD